MDNKMNNMLKEFLICAIIIIVILVGNTVTQGYSRNSIEEINDKLRELKQMLDDEEKNEEQIQVKKEEIEQDWEDMFSKLAYYIEHDELEKFARILENIKTYIEVKEYDNVDKEINEGIFILEHIEDKYSFNLQNIF